MFNCKLVEEDTEIRNFFKKFFPSQKLKIWHLLTCIYRVAIIIVDNKTIVADRSDSSVDHRQITEL